MVIAGFLGSPLVSALKLWKGSMTDCVGEQQCMGWLSVATLLF